MLSIPFVITNIKKDQPYLTKSDLQLFYYAVAPNFSPYIRSQRNQSYKNWNEN